MEEPTVGIVIPTFNHAAFLGAAIRSALEQTRPATEIIVVDDGSEDDPGAVVRDFPGVRLVRRANGGLSAARNSGLHATRAQKVIFLDADDLLHAGAIDAGLRAFDQVPDAAFVYGAHRRIDDQGNVLVPYRYSPIGPDPYVDFLTCNMIGMHATVMYDREQLVRGGGFDPALRRCEDYDVYLRLSRTEKVASHDAVVADYRWHGENMSASHTDMLDWVLRVHGTQEAAARLRPETARAYLAGRRIWKDYYAGEMLKSLSGKPAPLKLREVASAFAASPRVTLRGAVSRAKRQIADTAPFVKRWPPRFGHVDFGDLGSPLPISQDFGFDRGTPIDRYYIEGFLARHRADIRGRVLEVGDATYCERFGKGAVRHQDVLHVSKDARGATIVGDLAEPGVLPERAFDCMVLTQTLHLIYDMRAAVERIHGALRPGGVVLLTVPGISQLDRGEWNSTWSWSLTPYSARRLFSEFFAESQLQVSVFGNVFAATAFLQGVALEEIDREKLDELDAVYPVIVTVRAQRGLE